MSIGRDRKIPDDLELRERPQKAKKDTKRWCKGKVGILHDTEIVRDKGRHYNTNCTESSKRFGSVKKDWFDDMFWLLCNHIEQCQKCGKVIRFNIKQEECPDFINREKE